MTEPLLDHVVLAAPDLDDLVEAFHARTGIMPEPGGRHPDAGTSNFLVRIGPMSYLELIGPDPDRDDPDLPTVFGIDRLTGPRIAGWMVHPVDIEATVARALARGYDTGPIEPLSRRTPDGALLSWRLTLTAPDDLDGLVPHLIDWQGSPHPATQGLPEVSLVALRARHPDPAAVREALSALEVELDVEPADHAGMILVVDTPRGRVDLW